MINFNTKKYFKLNKGFSLIEVIVASTVLSVLSMVLLSATSKGIKLSNQALDQVQAGYLLEEGAESVKILRDTNWTNISSAIDNTTYYLNFNTSSNVWSLSTTPSTIDSFFTRTVVFYPVYRDGNDDISDAGTLDSGTKKVTVNVSWNYSEPSTKSLSFYVSNIFN